MAGTGLRLPSRLLTRRTMALLLSLATIAVLLNVRLDTVAPVTLKSVLRLAGGRCELVVTHPDTVPAGAAFPVKIQITGGSIRSVPRAEASVAIGGDSPGRTVTLYYGVGTASLSLPRARAWDVLVSVNGRVAHSAGGRAVEETCSEQFSIQAVDLDDPAVETRRIERGTLTGAALQWTKGFVVVEGVVTVPTGGLLVVNPGVFVLMKPDARIEVLGEAKLGTKEGEPIVFAGYPAHSGDEARPWSQLLFGRGARGSLHNAWFLQGGASAHSNFGNLDTQRVIHGEEGSDIAFVGGGIIDSVGGAIGGERCRLQVHHAVIARCNGGGSVQEAAVTLQNVHVTEIGQKQTGSSDIAADGFTFYSPRITPPDGEVSKISDSVFAVGGGLGIHHKGTDLDIESTIVEDFRRACVVTSGKKSRVTISSALLRNCLVGLQLSSGRPNVTVSNSVVVNNEVGIWYGDENAETGGEMELENTLAMGNADKNLKVYSNGAERTEADRGSENVRLKCFFVNSESVKRKARSQFRLVEKKHSPCLQPKISLNHSDCRIAPELPHGKCLWSEYNPETLSGVRLERLDLCDSCCKETTELTFGSFDHWRMLNVQNRKGATIHTGKVETREECGVSFAADLYQYTDSDCQKTKVQLKSVFSNILHFQGESHLRELKAHYFDRVMKTSLTPPSFGMILDFSNILDRNASSLAKSDVDCALSDRTATGVSAFVTAWLPDIGMYTRLSVLLADLVHPRNFFTYVAFLYLANCMKSGHSHFADKETNNYVLIDNDRCLVPERVASGDMPPAYRYRLDRLTDILFTKSHVCKVPQEMVDRLKLANSVSSTVPSLGVQFKDEVLADKVMAPLLLKEDPEIYEEVDGRASVLLAEYNSLCENSDADQFDSRLRAVYKTSPVRQAYLVAGRDYLLANFADGDDLAYLKVVSDGPRERVGGRLFNGGLAELVSYHVDRLVGLGRVPVAASRRLVLDGSVALQGVVSDDGEVVRDMARDGVTLGRYLSDVQAGKIRANRSVEWIASKLRRDPAHKHPVLDVIVVGKIKDLQRNVKLSSEVKNFLNHDASLRDLQELGITRQMTWDIIDMHLLDFLLHNPHRTTFATSELRLVSHDNSRAFSPDIGSKVCEPLLRCPPVFYSSVEAGEKSGCPESCPVGVEDADNYRNCRFRRGTLERIRKGSVDATEKDKLVNMLRTALSKEAISVDSHKDYFGSNDLYEGFQYRLVHLASHVKGCMETYGEHVFV